MRKTLILLLCMVIISTIALTACDKVSEVPTDVSFEINGDVATYTDPHYRLIVDIPHYDYFMYSFGFADPKDWIEVSPSGEGAPCRTLSLFYRDEEDLSTDYTIPHNGNSSNVIFINGWVSHTGYYSDFDGEEAEIKTDDGKRGFYKKSQSNGRVQMIFSIENEFCQIEVDVSEKAFGEIEEIIMDMFSSLKVYYPE